MRLHATIVRDRSSDHFLVPVMSLPRSPNARGGPVHVHEVSENVVELADGWGRRRIIHYRRGKIARMETTIVSARGLHERVDQRKDDLSFVSAFVEPGRMPLVAGWRGEILVRLDRGLVNYVAVGGERLYETADGKIVQERALRSGAQIFVWFDQEGRIRTKQIHDATGRRHFLAYDRAGLAKIRFDDSTELTRGAYGLWETDEREAVRKLELLEDGSIRWSVGRTMIELRGDGTRARRVECDDFTEFVRHDARGVLTSSMRASSEPNGIEKMVIRDALGIVSVRIASPRTDGGYDLRVIERAA